MQHYSFFVPNDPKKAAPGIKEVDMSEEVGEVTHVWEKAK
jgi:hypothetical protein